VIIVDTGFWVALFDHNDHFHQRAVDYMKKAPEPFVSTLPVMTEAAYLLQKSGGAIRSIAFARAHVRGAFSVFGVENWHWPRIVELMERYANLPMDLADASLVVLAEELGHGRILSIDQRDFNAYRWKNHHPFQNLFAVPSP
jgi:predicted nucleic acid-binding protein